MLIIWGFRGIARTLGTGLFFCPKCGVDRDYKHQKVTKWFTLFWIPLFPVGKSLGEQVRCDHCKTKFRTTVLDTPTSAVLTSAVRDASRVVVAALVQAGDAADPSVRAAAVTAVQQAGADDYDDATLSADLTHVDPSQLRAYLGPLAAGLNDNGREVFVGRVAGIVPVGSLNSGQLEIMQIVGASLGLSAAHLAGVLGTSVAPVAPAASSLPTLGAVVGASTQPPASWYPDPAGSGRRRWWDGQTWTDHFED